MPVSKFADMRDELEALRASALTRLSHFAFCAKNAAERIAYEGGKDAEQQIATTREMLDKAQQHLSALRDYQEQYAKAVEAPHAD